MSTLREWLAGVVPRVLLAAVLLVGVACVVTGFGQQSQVDDFDAFRVEFGRPGSDCDSLDFLFLDTANGHQLDCLPEGFTPISLFGDGPEQIPNFPSADSARVVALIRRLVPGGLDSGEQRQIQDLIHRIGYSLPRSEWPSQPIHYSGLWGDALGWTGVAIMVAGIAGFLVVRRPLRTLLAGHAN